MSIWRYRYMQAFSEGVVHTQSRDASLLLGLPLHTDIRIYRKALYIGLDLITIL